MSHLKSPQENAFKEIVKSLALLLVITEEMAERLVVSFADQIFPFRKFRTTRTMECEINSGV